MYEESKDERAPVFLQFLEAVFQIFYQEPESFEFTDDLLILLIEHSISGRYGNFLLNSQKQRDEKAVFVNTDSLWEHVLEDQSLRNPCFIPGKFPGMLKIETSVNKLSFWHRYHFKYYSNQTVSHPIVKIACNFKKIENELLEKISKLEQHIKELQEGESAPLSRGSESSKKEKSSSVDIFLNPALEPERANPTARRTLESKFTPDSPEIVKRPLFSIESPLKESRGDWDQSHDLFSLSPNPSYSSCEMPRARSLEE